MREFELLSHIYAANAGLAGGSVVIPPGDDMGMVRIGDRDILLAVDQLIEGRHYDAAVTPIHLVGRKALTRSVSDIAAMAARPVATLAAATLPPDFGDARATELFDAMRNTAEHFACPLVGGDIAIHREPAQPLICSVTVVAEPLDPGHPPRLRSAAEPGDSVYVTGAIGGSYGSDGLGHHLTFTPRVREAIHLYEHLGDRLHAMIDISDGLGRDLGHIASASNVAIHIEPAILPCRFDIPWRDAIGHGEDYELAFTATGEVPANIRGTPITRIGSVHAVPRGRVLADGEDISAAGWEHGRTAR